MLQPILKEFLINMAHKKFYRLSKQVLKARYYCLLGENGSMITQLPVETKPDTRLPYSHVGGQGLRLWSLEHLGSSSDVQE